jgi:class 3 adenylate cyclase
MSIPAGLAALSDIRRLPDSSTGHIDGFTPDTWARGLTAPARPDDDLPRHQEPRGEQGVVSITGQSGALIAPPSDRSVMRLAELRPLNGQNCTVLLTDVVKFSSSVRNNKDRLLIRDALFHLTSAMLHGIADVRSEDRGDGILTVVWPDIPTWMVIERLLNWMLPALLEHNHNHDDSTRIQLRAAVDVGPVTSDVMGFSGDAIINVSRLIEAVSFKRAMDVTGASLGVITTRFIYETVLKHDRDLAGYCQVRCKVKNFKEAAWMRVFDSRISPHNDPDPAVAC